MQAGFRIQYRIQRLFERATHHLAKVIANARLVDLNDFSHPFGLLVHSQRWTCRVLMPLRFLIYAA